MVLALALLLAASPSTPGSHEDAVREIEAARQRAAQAKIAGFNAYVDAHPEDGVAAVERCKLLRVTVDGDEDDAPDCLKELAEEHPRSPAAILYRLGFLGKDAAAKLARDSLADSSIAWTDKEKAAAHASLARNEKGAAASRDARLAMELDSSLDLTREIAVALFAEGRRSEGIIALSAHPESAPWLLLAKVRLLVEQKAYARALWLFETVKERARLEPRLQAEMLTGVGRLAEAAGLYESQQGVKREEALDRLLPLYVSLGDRESALRTYDELRSLGFKHDPLALRRLRLFRKFPGARFKARDFGGLCLLFCALLGIALLPGLFLVPLHYFSLWRRLRGPPLLETRRGERWGFRHVWLAGSLTFLSQVIFFLPLSGDQLRWAGLTAPDDLGQAFAGVFASYVLAAAVTTALLLFFRSDRFRLLGLGTFTPGKAAAQIALTLLVTYAVAAVSFRLIPAAGAPSVEQLIGSFLQAHGFLVTLLAVAGVIPLFEELLFRSLLLELCTRWLGFLWANAIQAAFFATLHGDPRRFIFYFVFGLLLGRLKRNSGGLLPGFCVHAINNAVVVLALNGLGAAALRPGKPPVPIKASDALVACASSDAAKARLDDLRKRAAAVTLNNLAWQLAIEPGTTKACLSEAGELMETALTQVPEDAGWLDTKATILYRQDKLDEAIELETAALTLEPGNAALGSNLDRFLRKRAADPPFKMDQQSNIPLDSMPYGGTLLVRYLDEDRKSSDGLSLITVGPAHAASFQPPFPNLSKFARPELVHVDPRGCTNCKPAAINPAFSPHDKEVDTYP
jgi:membrane protease YdiL (CAAX protease family)